MTELKIRNLLPKAKPCKVFYGDGLYLEISPVGFKAWRVKLSVDGRETRPTL
jgi:hypothetical protein